MDDFFKEVYGQVNTPETLICDMYNLIPDDIKKDENIKWLDPGCGTGVFSNYIVDRLTVSLNKEREKILKENIYMVEYNLFHISKLVEMFGERFNYSDQDYLLYEPGIKFDVIMGNPPYNSNHLKSIPQRQESLIDLSNNLSWIPIWQGFVKKSLELLNDGGYLCFITPSTWMKQDKADMYSLLTQYKIHKLYCLDSYEMYKLFNKEAQIPCSVFLLQKIPSDGIIQIYDKLIESYVEFKLSRPMMPIPMRNVTILKKMLRYTERYGSLANYLLITPLPSRKHEFNNECIGKYEYRNIHSCVLKNGKPTFKYKWSMNEGPFYYYGLSKLILAHGVYGFPYLDVDGTMGISNRDKFIFMGDLVFLRALEKLLSLKMIMYLYSATQYRMRFLDKHIYEFIPDISKLPNFEYEKISDEYCFDYFELNELEKSGVCGSKLWKS